MPTAKNEVKLKFGDKAKYESAIKNADTVYFITDTNQIFVGSSLVSSKCYYVTSEPSASNYGVGDIVVWKISENNAKICIVNSSGEFDMLSISIPTELKNPNALTFTGAVTGTYDGSAAKTVNIPAAITVDSSLSNTSTNPVQNKAVKSELDTKISKSGDTFSGTLTYNGGTTGSNPNNIAIDIGQGNLCNIDEIYGVTTIRIGEYDSSGSLNDYAGLTTYTDDEGKLYLFVQRFVVGEYVDDITLRGIGLPTDSSDAANKAYVDAKVPNVTTANNGQFLRVVNGVPTWVALTVAEEVLF